MLKLFTTFLVLFSQAYSYGQTESITQNPDQFKRIDLDSCLSWMQQHYTSNTDHFLKIGIQTLKRAEKKQNDESIAKIHETMADWHGYHGIFSPDSVVYHSEKALGYYKSSGNDLKVADTYRALSIDYMNTGELDKTQSALFKAIPLYETLDDEKGLGSAYRCLGVLYRVMEEFEKSIDYTQKAVILLEKTKDYASVAIAQFNLIISYGELNQFEEAYRAADYCIDLVNTKVPEEIFVPIRAHSYRGDVYLKALDYTNALKDFISAWELCKSHIGEQRCATYRTEIGQIYLLQKDYEKALEHLSIGVNAYEDKGQEGLVIPYRNLSETYANLGDFESAMNYKDKANNNVIKVLEDKISNLETEAIIKYETGKKDEALIAQAALLSQKSKVQQLIIAIASLLAILLLTLFFFFNKNKKKTQIIKAKSDENELLLKEIHHRVKNNLEMVKSLIALQSAQLDDPASKEAMLASQNRVQSMGIIHQKLYQGNNLGSIEMKDYFINLGDGILDTFNKEDKVTIECAMEQLELDVDTAVPIGLIVNELLTNALKYAFPKDAVGIIKISLSQTSSETLDLNVSDNGIGKIIDLTPQGTGFGSQLIKLLTLQLDGKMTEKIDRGTKVSFQFKMKKAA